MFSLPERPMRPRAGSLLWQVPPPPAKEPVHPTRLLLLNTAAVASRCRRPLRRTMKIVLAEKVSPATLAVFQSEAGWQIVTHDQIKKGLAAELADADALVVRSAV